jgi:hypothetical protein
MLKFLPALELFFLIISVLLTNLRCLFQLFHFIVAMN